MHNRGANRTARRGLDGIRARAWAKFGFVAPRRSSVALTKGAGAFSFTRATTATVEDWEGAIRVCKSGEVRFPGARRVENLIATTSEDFSNAAWVKNNATATYAGGISRLTATATSSAYATQSIPISGGPANKKFRVTARLRGSKNGVAGLSHFPAAPNDFTHAPTVTYFNITTEWGIYTSDVATIGTTASSHLSTAVYLSAGSATFTTVGDWIEIDWIQLEDITGQSNQNPSEYVSVGVLSSPFHGAMVDGVKYFEHQNGNTVASNVVTEAMGATLTTCKGQLDETASTNRVYPSSIATWSPSGTPTVVAAAKYCGSVPLDLVGDDDAAATERFATIVSFTGDGSKSVSLLVAQGSAANTFIQLAGLADRLAAVITWSGGAPTVSFSVGSQERPPKALQNGVYRLFLLASGVIAAETNTIRIAPGATSLADSAGTGTIYIGGVQAENATTASSHIPTTTGAVTRNADAGSYPSAGNVSASGGTLYLEYEIERDFGAAGDGYLAEIGDGTVNERVAIYRSTAGNLAFAVVDGGVLQCNMTLGAAPVGSAGKVAARWTANGFAAVMTGGAILTDASGTLPDVTTIYPGSGRLGAHLQGPTKNLRISQQLLSNAELLALVK